MTTYPLATMACTVSSTGISAPSFADILGNLQYLFQGIYGSDTYLDPDSPDGQWLGILADAINDSNSATIATYNAFSPATAQGTGLSSVVKINGLARDVSTNSTVIVTIVGQVGTVITNGIIGDNASLGTQWALPASVTIPSGGSINETATSTTPGAIGAAENTLTVILTPTAGWQTVNNPSNAAIPGAPVETDAELRIRQAESTALPAESVVGGIYGAVANLTGVQRLKIYENDTSSEDSNGLPDHSISVVVAGGSATSIAQTIEIKKTPGTNTYGSTSEVVFDPIGLPITINFYELAEVAVSVVVNIKALTNYVSTTASIIQQAVAGFISGLAIGELSYLGRLYGPANLSGDAATTATGLSQAALDVLAATYTILSISQSRVTPPVDTTVVNEIMAAATTGTLTSAANVFVGSTIKFTLDDASHLTVTIATSNQTSGVITFSPAITGGRNVPAGSNVYLVSDVQIAFNEAATAATTNVTVNAS